MEFGDVVEAHPANRLWSALNQIGPIVLITPLIRIFPAHRLDHRQLQCQNPLQLADGQLIGQTGLIQLIPRVEWFVQRHNRLDGIALDRLGSNQRPTAS